MLWLVQAKLLLHQQGLGDRQTETGLGGHAEVGRELLAMENVQPQSHLDLSSSQQVGVRVARSLCRLS